MKKRKKLSKEKFEKEIKQNNGKFPGQDLNPDLL